MKTILTTAVAAMTLLYYLVPTEIKPLEAHKPTKPQPTKIVHKKVKDDTTLISGSVSFIIAE